MTPLARAVYLSQKYGPLQANRIALALQLGFPFWMPDKVEIRIYWGSVRQALLNREESLGHVLTIQDRERTDICRYCGRPIRPEDQALGMVVDRATCWMDLFDLAYRDDHPERPGGWRDLLKSGAWPAGTLPPASDREAFVSLEILMVRLCEGEDILPLPAPPESGGSPVHP